MNPLYLIHLPIDVSALGQWAANRGVGRIVRLVAGGKPFAAGYDEGRALHHFLTETFGKGALQPFRLLVSPGMRAGLYGYSPIDGEDLRGTAAAAAMPEIAHICDWSQLAAKQMPQEWRPGRRLAFDLRIRPTRRLMKPLPLTDGTSMAKGREVDAFLVEALRQFPANDKSDMKTAGRCREVVYRDWLAEKLKSAGDLIVEKTQLARFARTRVARDNAAPEGPDVVFHGELLLRDGIAFDHLLRHGVGRHAAYGYGMLLVRPPGVTRC